MDPASVRETAPRVGLFVTCLVDFYRPNVGFAAVKLLEEAGCEVVVPEAQTCCGNRRITQVMQPRPDGSPGRLSRALSHSTTWWRRRGLALACSESTTREFSPPMPSGAAVPSGLLPVATN